MAHTTGCCGAPSLLRGWPARPGPCGTGIAGHERPCCSILSSQLQDLGGPRSGTFLYVF